MCGRITLSVSLHPVDCTLLERVKRVAIAAYAVAAEIAGQRRDLLGCSWLAGLGKLLQSIELLAEHAFYSWRDLLESADR